MRLPACSNYACLPLWMPQKSEGLDMALRDDEVFGPELHDCRMIMIMEDLVTGERQQWTFKARESGFQMEHDYGHSYSLLDAGPYLGPRHIDLGFTFGDVEDLRITMVTPSNGATQSEPAEVEANPQEIEP
jgi:hypothetical protein